MKRLLNVKTHFDAAHCLKDYEGDCSNLHGHRWEVQHTFLCQLLLPEDNMAIDFKHLKEAIKATLPDHKYLNEEFQEDNPTAEFLAEKLFNRFQMIAPNEPVDLIAVEVWESPECSAMFVAD